MKSALTLFAGVLLSFLPVSVWAHSPEAGTSWSQWDWRADVLAVLFLFGLAYTAGWLRLRIRSPRVVPWWQLGLYLTGLGAIFLALVSPIDALAEESLSMHMVQHLLLIMIAPLFLLLSNPLPASLWGLPKKLRTIVGRLLVKDSSFRRALQFLTFIPVAWLVYVIDLWVWHHPLLYQAALRDRLIHDVEHLLFFFTALLFWWPIANPAPRLHRSSSYGFRIGYLIAATLQNTILGMVISLPDRVLYPFYSSLPLLRSLSPINDQALGGGIMWVNGHMYLVPILFLVARYRVHEEKLQGILHSRLAGSKEWVR